MRGLPGPSGKREPEETRIFHPAGQFNPQPTLSPQENALPPPATNYTVTALNAYTVYEFQVLAENSAGKAASPWVSGRTLEARMSYMINYYYFIINLDLLLCNIFLFEGWYQI